MKPSTASWGDVACSAGVVVVKEALAALPCARFGSVPDWGVRSVPAFWNMSTTRALSERLVCSASASSPLVE